MACILLGIAELNVARAPDTLATIGLGSCIGLSLHDAYNKIGGMVHIMLPEAPPNAELINRAKYADTAFEELLKKLLNTGAKRFRLTAKLAGGAHMFGSASGSDIMKIGQRNIDVCKRILCSHSIPLEGEDTGGTAGRSIELDCCTGLLKVRTAWPKTEKTI